MGEKNEVHFNVDNIDYIKFTPRHRSRYIWQPIRPKKTYFFGLIVDYHEIPAGWSDNIGCERVGPEWLEGYNFRYVGGLVAGKNYSPMGHWDKRAYVYVRTKQTDHGRYFDTDEEAEAWVEDLKAMSKHEFDFYTQ